MKTTLFLYVQVLVEELPSAVQYKIDKSSKSTRKTFQCTQVLTLKTRFDIRNNNTCSTKKSHLRRSNILRRLLILRSWLNRWREKRLNSMWLSRLKSRISIIRLPNWRTNTRTRCVTLEKSMLAEKYRCLRKSWMPIKKNSRSKI